MVGFEHHFLYMLVPNIAKFTLIFVATFIIVLQQASRMEKLLVVAVELTGDRIVEEEEIEQNRTNYAAILASMCGLMVATPLKELTDS